MSCSLSILGEKPIKGAPVLRIINIFSVDGRLNSGGNGGFIVVGRRTV